MVYTTSGVGIQRRVFCGKGAGFIWAARTVLRLGYVVVCCVLRCMCAYGSLIFSVFAVMFFSVAGACVLALSGNGFASLLLFSVGLWWVWGDCYISTLCLSFILPASFVCASCTHSSWINLAVSKKKGPVELHSYVCIA